MQPGFQHRTRLIPRALLAMTIAACSGSPYPGSGAPQHGSGSPQPGTARSDPAPGSTPTTTSTAGFAGAGHPEPAGPPPPTTREIHGYFTSTTARNSMRFWKGPNDREGFERLTRFTVEVDGTPEYSRAVSTAVLVGVCRSRDLGLDQLLLSFHPERRGGGALGVLRYDTENRRFVLGYSRRDARFDCAGDRALFPEGATALPCTCPWGDGPDDPSRTTTGAPGGEREIQILPEQNGGPPFTRGEPGAALEGDSSEVDRP